MAVEYENFYLIKSCAAFLIDSEDFVLAKITPTLVTQLGYKIFLMFASINIGAMAVFSL